MAHSTDVQWEVAQTFVHDETGVMVTVKRLPLARPKFSMSIGVEIGEGEAARPAPFLPGNRTSWDATDFAPIVSDLVSAGQDYIMTEAVKAADELAQKTAADAERESAKRARHMENVEARRVANRAAAAAVKGGKKKKAD